jgi:hypothetical protein
MEYLGITNYGSGIGDKIQFTALPENYFKSTGNKIIDLDKSWVFDYNPYIARDINPTIGITNLWISYPEGKFLSGVDRINTVFNIKTTLRHPRLYHFESEEIVKNTLVVHSCGKSFGTISDKVIAQILENYIEYNIYQIGGQNDKKTPFINKLGLSMWETIKLIASSEVFIGVNSGFMNIAKCYPKIRKKVIINGIINPEIFSPNCNGEYWIDYNWEYFNETENDIGISNSYLKI